MKSKNVKQNPIVETGWSGVPGATGDRSSKVHLFVDGKPACGSRLAPKSEFQCCARRIWFDVIECEKCRLIAMKLMQKDPVVPILGVKEVRTLVDEMRAIDTKGGQDAVAVSQGLSKCLAIKNGGWALDLKAYSEVHNKAWDGSHLKRPKTQWRCVATFVRGAEKVWWYNVAMESKAHALGLQAMSDKIEEVQDGKA